MRVSQKELEDNFDILLDMIENKTIQEIYVDDPHDKTKSVVLISTDTFNVLNKIKKIK